MDETTSLRLFSYAHDSLQGKGRGGDWKELSGYWPCSVSLILLLHDQYLDCDFSIIQYLDKSWGCTFFPYVVMFMCIFSNKNSRQKSHSFQPYMPLIGYRLRTQLSSGPHRIKSWLLSYLLYDCGKLLNFCKPQFSFPI